MRSRTVFVLLLAGAWSAAQEQPTQPLVHFHHVHLNAMYPELAMQRYTRHFESERAKLGGAHALWVGKPWILVDKVNVPIFPMELLRQLFPAEWEGRKHPESPKGHALDHFAFSCDNLDAMLARLRNDGVKIVEEPKMRSNGAMRSAFIEGPDSVL